MHLFHVSCSGIVQSLTIERRFVFASPFESESICATAYILSHGDHSHTKLHSHIEYSILCGGTRCKRLLLITMCHRPLPFHFHHCAYCIQYRLGKCGRWTKFRYAVNSTYTPAHLPVTI